MYKYKLKTVFLSKDNTTETILNMVQLKKGRNCQNVVRFYLFYENIPEYKLWLQ